MRGFSFSLAENTGLVEHKEGFFLFSRQPIRALRVNESLFKLLQRVTAGEDFANTETLNTLFSLTGKGYLMLNRMGEIEDYPIVSIIIPVRDQPVFLVDCLASLEELDYPKDRLEIIVIDDGSKKDVSRFVSSSSVNIIRLEESKGPAAARNTGAAKATGDILAFLDADCTAGQGWLKELVPFFRAAGVGAVGGYVSGYHHKTALDRYEQVSSSLTMGKRLLFEGKSESGFYVPTANLLVKRDVFISASGFNERMRVGEDVDFCWRMRDAGLSLVYAPHGKIAHKHRNLLVKMLKRRGYYGTSEALLYRLHRDKKKGMGLPVYHLLAFLAMFLALAMLNPWPLAAIPLLLALDIWDKKRALGNFVSGIKLPHLTGASLRSLVSFWYYAFFHLVRYYLVPLLVLGFFWHQFWAFSALAVIYPAFIDYDAKKPDLHFPAFFWYYLLEHLAYQVGVFWGCIGEAYFGSYIVRFKRI